MMPSFDWLAFGICVGTIIPSACLLALLVRYILRNGDQRLHCFKDPSISEDCEILVSTTTRGPITREFIREVSHSHVLTAGSGPSSASSSFSLPHHYTEAPPSYSHAPNTSISTQMSSLSLPNSTEHIHVSGMSAGSTVTTSAAAPPIYGSDTALAIISPPSYHHHSSHQSLTPEMTVLDLNAIIMSLDLLPEVASIPPPPSYDEHVRHSSKV